MPAEVYGLLVSHLERVPPGDYLQHYLTAQGQAMLYNGFIKKKEDPPRDPYDFAPWLKTPEVRARLKRQQAEVSAQGLQSEALELTRG